MEGLPKIPGEDKIEKLDPVELASRLLAVSLKIDNYTTEQQQKELLIEYASRQVVSSFMNIVHSEIERPKNKSVSDFILSLLFLPRDTLDIVCTRLNQEYRTPEVIESLKEYVSDIEAIKMVSTVSWLLIFTIVPNLSNEEHYKILDTVVSTISLLFITNMAINKSRERFEKSIVKAVTAKIIKDHENGDLGE